jgi:hypothetical protein
MRNRPCLLTSVLTLSLALFACGSAAQAQSAEETSPVEAAPAATAPYVYSDASIVGNYSFVLGGVDQYGNYAQLIGVFSADGKGNISAGDMTLFGLPDEAETSTPCEVTFVGSYTVTKYANGTATLYLKPQTGSVCSQTGSSEMGTFHFYIQLGAQGVTALFAESSGPHLPQGSGFTGTANRQ